MKAKLRFDLKAIQAFLLQNVEKIVFGFVVLGCLAMLYAGWTRAGRFEKTPEQLRQAVDLGRRTIDQANPNEILKGLVVHDYAAEAERSRLPISADGYAFGPRWTEPLFAANRKRTTPPLFNVRQLRGMAEVGAFREAPNAAAPEPAAEPKAAPRPKKRAEPKRGGGLPPVNAPGLPPVNMPGLPPVHMPGGAAPGAGAFATKDVGGRRWVVLTALVPIREQEAAFVEALKPDGEHYNPQTDHPIYEAFLVERVEVGDSADPAGVDWTKATRFPSWATRDRETATWGDQPGDVVDQEYIDEQLTFPLGPLNNRPWGPGAAHEPEIPYVKPELDDTGMGAAMPGVVPGQVPGTARGGDESQTREDDPFGKRPDNAGPKKSVDKPKVAEEKKASSYKLFRFFDFNVEPGKRYVYRVQLALKNPNEGKKVSWLEKPELAKDKFILTKWSDPSPVIAVPRDARILLASVKPPRGSADAGADILATSWLKKNGSEAHKDFAVGRGQVANYLDQTVDGNKVNFRTDTALVDIRGGEKLPGRTRNALTEPGQILVLEPDGALVVRDELDDMPACDALTKAGETPEGDGPPGPRPSGNPLDMFDGGSPRRGPGR